MKFTVRLEQKVLYEMIVEAETCSKAREIVMNILESGDEPDVYEVDSEGLQVVEAYPTDGEPE